MVDTITGSVVEIINGDTFEIRITNVENESREKYEEYETVKISGSSVPDGKIIEGQGTKQDLMCRISGLNVICKVIERDHRGRIVAEVMI